jgi:hypothetical protein
MVRVRRKTEWALIGLMVALTADAAAAAECERRFDQSTDGMPDTCVFVGRYNPTCGSEAVAFFAGDGTAVVLSLAPSATAPPLFIAAQALSATEGKLVLWRSDLDIKQAPSVGSVHLESNGQRLVVRLDPGLANVGGCPIREFVGRFAGMAVANDASPPRRPGPIAAIAAIDPAP